MIKSLLIGTTAVLFCTSAFAQGVDLFPELEGRFQPAQPTTMTTLEATPANTATSADGKTGNSLNRYSDLAFQPAQERTVSAEEATGPKREGNLKLHFEDIQGTLPYARNFSYCFANLVLNNETNQRLDKLQVVLTYRDTPTTIDFSGVDKKGEQAQRFTLIGPACEDILTQPLIDVPVCKLGELQEDLCKKKVEFVPPNS